MHEIEFIKDVIYHLKLEYGTSAILRKRTESMNIDTGIKTQTDVNTPIGFVIQLPVDRRTAFLKAIGIHQAAYTELNNTQYLVDTDDVASSLPTIKDLFVCDGYEHVIQNVETFPGALILTVNNPPAVAA